MQLQKLTKKELEKYQSIRQHLHTYPELSGYEKETSRFLQQELQQLGISVIHKLGGYSFAVVFDTGIAGNTILLRADFDALPIHEESEKFYRSEFQNVAHLCGHDGHATILLGVAAVLSKQPLPMGKVILLFQAEEETGTGALKVLKNQDFQMFQPDFVFALHGLPDFPLGSIIIRENHFAAASIGMIVKLFGKTAHAAQPEYATSPAKALADLIMMLQRFSTKHTFENYTLLTITYARLGDIAFGTTPGEATLMATLRACETEDLQKMVNVCQRQIYEICKREKLRCEVKWAEEFIAAINDSAACKYVETAAQINHYEIVKLKNLFRWSEDFGYFTNQFPGALFGIGLGENHPQLHHPDFDFPDDIIEIGVNMFLEIIKVSLG
jgi:amidohydrolase